MESINLNLRLVTLSPHNDPSPFDDEKRGNRKRNSTGWPAQGWKTTISLYVEKKEMNALIHREALTTTL